MKIKFKDTSNTSTKAKQGAMSRTPLLKSSQLHSDIYNIKPVNSNSQNLAFTGFLYKEVKIDNYKEVLKTVEKYSGKGFEDLYKNLSESDIAKKLIKTDGDNLIFNTKKIKLLVMDGILYPFKVLPLDMLNGAVNLLKKVKPLQKWAEDVSNKPFFQNIRQRSKIDAKVNSLRGAFETVLDAQGEIKKALGAGDNDKAKLLNEKLAEKLSSDVLKHSLSGLDTKTGNYDTKHERSLNRIVSGMIPAVFLANDAYNLSSMCDDNKKEASKEQKTRFRQEISRVGLQAYITLITLGALQKYINNSKFAIMATTGLTVLLTEMFSRLSSGKFIRKIKPEEAKAINEKENNIKEQKINDLSKNNDYQAVFFKSQAQPKAFAQFCGKPSAETEKQQDKPKANEPLLSVKNMMKAIVASIGIGYALKGLKGIKVLKNVENELTGEITKKPVKVVEEFLNKAWAPFKKAYSKLAIKEDHILKKSEFDTIMDRLKNKEIGFENLAETIEKVVQKQGDLLVQKDIEKLAKKNKDLKELILNGDKVKDVVKNFDNIIKELENKGLTELVGKIKSIKAEYDNNVHFGKMDGKHKTKVDFLLTPFRFAWNVVSGPFRYTELARKSIFKSKKEVKSAQEINFANIKKSITRLSKEALKEDFDQAKFTDFMKDNLKKGFNAETMSKIENSDLSQLAKTSATIATLGFLMSDNYNMVMLKSNGEDVKGAEMKSNERLVQETSRFFYQTMLIDFFNNTFRNMYNNSLLGMSILTMANTTLGEILTRKSVGMPIKAHSRDEIVQIEKDKENASPAVKGYYKFMSKLTGKKSLAEQHKAKEEKKA